MTDTKIESKTIHNSHSFTCMLKAAELIAEALTAAGLAHNQAEINLTPHAFSKIYDDRTMDGVRPEWRAYGISINSVDGDNQ